MIEFELLMGIFFLFPIDNILFSCTTKKEGETMSKKHGYCGNCMFCLSVCSECGSTDVSVEGNISFSYRNDAQDEIDMSIELEDVWSFKCNACDLDIGSDGLDNLESAISDDLPDSLMAEYKDGKVYWDAGI